jgi:hypothetical protein
MKNRAKDEPSEILVAASWTSPDTSMRRVWRSEKWGYLGGIFGGTLCAPSLVQPGKSSWSCWASLRYLKVSGASEGCWLRMADLYWDMVGEMEMEEENTAAPLQFIICVHRGNSCTIVK